MCPAIDAVLVYVNKKWVKLTGEDTPLPQRMPHELDSNAYALHSHGCFQDKEGADIMVSPHCLDERPETPQSAWVLSFLYLNSMTAALQTTTELLM